MSEEPKGTVTLNVTWLGFGLTIIAQVVAFVFFLARIDAGLSEMQTDVVRLEATVNSMREEMRILQSDVGYLCNERRRDNQEAGRNGTPVC